MTVLPHGQRQLPEAQKPAPPWKCHSAVVIRRVTSDKAALAAEGSLVAKLHVAALLSISSEY